MSGSAIRLETGQPGRFAQVGDFVSYCPCVKAERTSNGKKKGELEIYIPPGTEGPSASVRR